VNSDDDSRSGWRATKTTDQTDGSTACRHLRRPRHDKINSEEIRPLLYFRPFDERLDEQAVPSPSPIPSQHSAALDRTRRRNRCDGSRSAVGARRIAVLLALLCGALGACAARTPVKAPSLRLEPLPAVEPSVDQALYRLQAGDVIAVRFWGNEELNDEQTIRPDGRISLPFIDEVQAAGLTTAQLDEQLTQLYASELASPNVTIIVRKAVAPRVYVGGEVNVRGSFELTDHLTLLRVLQQAGGFTTFARRKQVLLIRQQADGSGLARSIDLRPVLSGADLTADLNLKANDVILVLRSKIKSLNLFIDQYIDDVIPLQSIFGGIILADVARGNNSNSSNSSNSGSNGTTTTTTTGTGGGGP
jgi:polysaccharide biosynthesis/export protein